MSVPSTLTPRRGATVGGRARRVSARARRQVARTALRSERNRGFGPEEKRTLALGVIAAGATAAVTVAEVGRVWRRGPTPLPSEADDLLQAAEEAVAVTVEAAVAGYQDVSVRENALFALLASFVITFASARGIAYTLRGRKRVGPFHNVIVGRRHIHHFVPGIAISFLAGTVSILKRSEKHQAKLALAFGTGMGLTLDESALLLELEDVYWSPDGLLGVQITLSVAALIAALSLAVRFARHGERLVAAEEQQVARPHTVPAGANGPRLDPGRPAG